MTKTWQSGDILYAAHLNQLAQVPDIGIADTPTGTALGATYGSQAPLGWALPRDVDLPNMPVPPTVTWNPYGGGNLYANLLAADTDLVTHPGGVYETIDFFGHTYLQNTVNLPDTHPWESNTEFTASGSQVAVWVGVWDGDPTHGNARVLVDGRVAYSGAPGVGGVFFLDLEFPFAATRLIRVELDNMFFGGITYPNTADIYPPVLRKPRAALFGDSWVSGAGGVQLPQLTAYRLGVGLGWDVARMGHGGSGYAFDLPGDSAPMSDPTRLAKLAAQQLDYVIFQGSINDGDPAATQAAAASCYAYLAQHSPQTRVIVVGPQPTAPGTIPAARLAVRDAVRAAAVAAPNVVRWLDPIAGDWMPDASLFLAGGSDPHPTADGHATWTRRLMQEMTRAAPRAA